jgi:hypothetical protein
MMYNHFNTDKEGAHMIGKPNQTGASGIVNDIYDTIRDDVFTALGKKPVEVMTKRGLWFRASLDQDCIIIEPAKDHVPSCQLTMHRRITKKSFNALLPYSNRLAAGDTSAWTDACKISTNTSYIFALIEHLTIYNHP